MKSFDGEILFLDRADINTDEIIPARYLTEVDKPSLKSHLLEDLGVPGFDPGRDLPGKAAIVARANFGCGSSREHAVWALEANGINLVIAESFSRIFRQNMYNCGLLAVELEPEIVEEIVRRHRGTQTTVSVDFDAPALTVSSQGRAIRYPFAMAPFDRTLVEAGGWVEYADSRY